MRDRALQETVAWLQQHSDPVAQQGLHRFGIQAKTVLGIRIPVLRSMAREMGTNHPLALQLWETGIHEARLLAVFIADWKQVDEPLMERWAAGFDSWDLCDQCCGNLFDRTSLAFQKAAEWSSRPEEFVKRAGFSMMAALAVHRKKAADADFIPFFALIEKEAGDSRNFVKKSVNWALRQIGKRKASLNRMAIEVARSIAAQPSSSARWIASDALRELTDEKLQRRLKV